MTTQRIIRFGTVRELTGYARSTLYLRIHDGLFSPPVALGPRSRGWPESEIAAINSARIRGASDDDIRALVAALVAARQNAA